MALPKITFATKVDKRGNSLPRKNKVVAADMNEIKSKFNQLSDFLDLYTGGLNFQTGTTEEGENTYTFPALDNRIIVFVQFQNAILTPEQYLLEGEDFTLVMAAEDITAGMFINIAYR